ncbi:MAG: hypothetical protein NT052_02495 [Candidatus Shapirobacteria bacterium]|nr:hypothetical protein [Candidatus Shapirobacteria bacterium]
MLRLNKNETEKKEYFFALEIDVDRVKSAIWTIEGDQSKLMSLGEIAYWEKESELLESVDNSLSSAIEKLSPQLEVKEPEKIIFGLSSDWIEQNKILSEKIEILKKISQKMGLTPLGFMIVPEAIVHWLKKLEGVPLNAILVSLSKKKITVSLVEQGKVVQTNLVVRSENLGADLTEGLSRINHEMPFPARILLYDHEEKLEEARQELINWPWTEEKINFLHLPKVEILAADFDIKAIVLASASQMAEVKGLEEAQTQENPSINTTPQYQVDEEKPKEELVPDSTFGFIKDQDIAELENKILFHEETEEKKFMPEEKNEKPNFEIDKKRNFNFSFLKSIPVFLKSIHWPAFSVNNRNLSPNKNLTFLGLAIGILVILMVGLGFLYWYLPQASITLFVKPEVLEKDFEVKLDPSLTSPDRANLILPGIKVETVVGGSKEAITTGTKLIGDKAKGKVTVYNRTDKEKTLAAGTEIIGPSNLKFTLNDKVAIASESAGSDYIKVPGKVEVSVTATAIGSDGNLASGSEFIVGNLAKTDFVAKNEASFSEGTSREIQVVAKADQEKLLADLQKELEQKAIEDLKNKVSLGKKLVDTSLTTQITEKTFNKKIDDEANSLSLNLKIQATVLSFSEEEFKQLAGEQIKNLIPDGFSYDSNQTEMSFKTKESSEKNIFVFEAHFKANLVPQLDLETIRKNLLGKKPVIGETYLSNLSHVDSFTAEINPRLPEGIATFPRVLKRITIKVENK